MTTLAVERQVDYFKLGLRLLYAVSLTIYVYFLVDGISYYQLPFQERPHAEDYRNLRPAGFRGQGFGIIGSTMMLLMLLYSVRKRTRFFGDWGMLSRWLDIHIYFGVMGPLFIILHTTFKTNGIIALSFWSMIAVASSGILGRYLYLQIPRNRSGEELDMAEIDRLNQQFLTDVGITKGVDVALIDKVSGLKPSAQNEGLFRILLRMIAQDLLGFVERIRIRGKLRKELNLEGELLEQAVQLTTRRRRLQRRTLFLNQIQRIFHYWHVFHKPFAILMYVIMFIHIGVAIWLGYTWIF